MTNCTILFVISSGALSRSAAFFNHETVRETDSTMNAKLVSRVRKSDFLPVAPFQFAIASSASAADYRKRKQRTRRLLLLSHPVLSRPIPCTQRVPRLATLSSLRPSEPLSTDNFGAQPFSSPSALYSAILNLPPIYNLHPPLFRDETQKKSSTRVAPFSRSISSSRACSPISVFQPCGISLLSLL